MNRRRICARFPWQKNARLRAKSQSAELALMFRTDPSKYFRATALRRNAAMTVSSGNSDSADNSPLSPLCVVRRSCVHCLNWLIPKDLTVNCGNCVVRGHDLVGGAGHLPAGDDKVASGGVHLDPGGVLAVGLPGEAAERDSMQSVPAQAQFRVSVQVQHPLFDLGLQFAVDQAMVEVDAHDAHAFGEHDADASVARLAGLQDGFFVGKPDGGVVVLRRAPLAVLGDLVQASRRARAGAEGEPDSHCLEAGGTPALLAACFGCGDGGASVPDVPFAAGVAVLGDPAPLRLGHP